MLKAGLRDSPAKPSCLLLVLGLGPLSKRYRGWGLTESGGCLFEEIYDVVKHESRPAIHMEKLLSTAVSWVGWSLRGSLGWGKQSG